MDQQNPSTPTDRIVGQNWPLVCRKFTTFSFFFFIFFDIDLKEKKFHKSCLHQVKCLSLYHRERNISTFKAFESDILNVTEIEEIHLFRKK